MKGTIRNGMERSYFCGYQLIGADNIVRFCNIILKLQPTKTEHGCAQIGISTSGQNIRSLTNRILRHKSRIGAKVLICIGTNDVINLTPISKVKIQLRCLRKALRGKEIVFLTVPPLLKYWGDPERMLKTGQYNDAIKKLQGDSVYVLDLYEFMINSSGTPREELYERYYKRPFHLRHLPEREDLIRFNKMGMMEIAQWLQEKLPM